MPIRRINSLLKKRLEDRKSDPLKQWKISPIDDQPLKYWKAYSAARNEMLARTHNPTALWTLVRANDKRLRGSRGHNTTFSEIN